LNTSFLGFITCSITATGVNGFTIPISGGGFQIHTGTLGAFDSWVIIGDISNVVSNVGTDWQAYSNSAANDQATQIYFSNNVQPPVWIYDGSINPSNANGSMWTLNVTYQ
jgi:hypothetical protein